MNIRSLTISFDVCKFFGIVCVWYLRDYIIKKLFNRVILLIRSIFYSKKFFSFFSLLLNIFTYTFNKLQLVEKERKNSSSYAFDSYAYFLYKEGHLCIARSSLARQEKVLNLKIQTDPNWLYKYQLREST